MRSNLIGRRKRFPSSHDERLFHISPTFLDNKQTNSISLISISVLNPRLCVTRPRSSATISHCGLQFWKKAQALRFVTFTDTVAMERVFQSHKLIYLWLWRFWFAFVCCWRHSRQLGPDTTQLCAGDPSMNNLTNLLAVFVVETVDSGGRLHGRCLYSVLEFASAKTNT